MPEWIVSLITAGVLGTGALIVWIVHNLSKPWFNSRTDAAKAERESKERMSLNGFNSNEKVVERLMNNFEKYLDTLTKTTSEFPKSVDRLSDKMDLHAQEMKVTNEHLSNMNKKLDTQTSEIIKEFKNYQIKDLQDRIAHLPPDSSLVKKVEKTETTSITTT